MQGLAKDKADHAVCAVLKKGVKINSQRNTDKINQQY